MTVAELETERPVAGSRSSARLAGLAIVIGLSTVASDAKARLHDPGTSGSEDVPGTLSVIPSSESADGQPVACGFQFSATGRDPDSGPGALVKVVGSYHLRRYAVGIVGYSLKLGIYDGLAWEHPVPPHDALVRAPLAATASSVSRLPAETPGFALFFGLLGEPPGSAGAAIVDDGMLVVGFRRTPGRQPVTVVVNLRVAATQTVDGRVVRTLSTTAIDEFSACTRGLLKVPGR